MNIICSGGLGFIGSHTVDLLIDHGHDVSIIDNLSTGRIENKNVNAKLYMADIRDKGFMHDVIQEENPDVLIHFAAQSSVAVSMNDPLNDCEININGTLNLLNEFSKLKDVKNKRFVFISSAAVYGYNAYNSKENDLLDPKSYYAISKATGEFYVKTFAELYGFSYTIFRPSCVFGERQVPNGESAVIAIFKEKMLKDLPCKIFKEGNQKRDFIWVKEVAKACAMASEMPNMGNQTYNISSQTYITIDELFDHMKKIFDSKSEKIYDNAPRPWDANIVLLINRKLKSEGWEPNIDFFNILRGMKE